MTIQSLNVASNEIHLSEHKHLELFKQAIVYSDLKELDLSSNKLGDEGIRVVAGALQVRSRLEKLNLASCDFRLDTTGGY